MMTDGLKLFAGRSLKNMLQKWTATTGRAVLAGASITALVQSSSAVTVALIGFVNAGILTLRQALGVIFGANIGTTITGWLVSLIGFGIKIEALGLPILAAGVLMQFTAATRRYKNLGIAITGFGLFFLGLAVLKDAFSGIADTFGASILTTGNVGGALIYVLVGFIATVLTQSSSAAIALILVAASQGVIGTNVAAAAVIGANVGTTSTAVIAAIKATSNAKRVAAGHVLFNVVTGLVALALLPLVIWFVSTTGQMIGIGDRPAPFLAFFHTVFNIMGVLLIAPFTTRLARLLERLFRSQEEDLGRPRYLDKTLFDTPALALPALWNELDRLFGITVLQVLAVLKDGHAHGSIQRRSEAIAALHSAVNEYAVRVRMKNMDEEQSEELPLALRTGRYLEEASILARQLRGFFAGESKTNPQADKLIHAFVEASAVTLPDTQATSAAAMDTEAYARFEAAYQAAKGGILKEAAANHIDIEAADEILDSLSHARRMIEQVFKAGRTLERHRMSTDNSPPVPA